MHYFSKYPCILSLKVDDGGTKSLDQVEGNRVEHGEALVVQQKCLLEVIENVFVNQTLSQATARKNKEGFVYLLDSADVKVHFCRLESPGLTLLFHEMLVNICKHVTLLIVQEINEVCFGNFLIFRTFTDLLHGFDSM